MSKTFEMSENPIKHKKLISFADDVFSTTPETVDMPQKSQLGEKKYVE